MERQMQDKPSDSYWVNHHPEYSRTLYHIIKYHPLLCHFFERLAYKRVGCERSSAGIVPVLSADNEKELNLAVTRTSNVEKKMTPYSSVAKNSERSQIKALVFIEIPKNGSRHHRSSTYPFLTINMDKNLLRTFLQDPVSPLVKNFHKHTYSSKVMLSRSLSFPPLDSSSKTQGFEATGDGSLPKGKEKLCFDDKTQKSVQLESSKKSYVRAMSSLAKWGIHGNFDINEVMMVKDVNSSSGSAQDQKQKEIKHFKNLKQKIEHATGESIKEKLRVSMDAVIHKLPQGHGISDDLKMEILKKLTDPSITKERENYPESCNQSDHSTPSFTKHHKHRIRRIWSFQESLESYGQLHESSFKTESRSPQSKQLKPKTEKPHTPLRMIPFKRIHSLPDLHYFSFSNQNGEIFGDGTMCSENIAYPKKRLDLNVHSKSNLELSTPEENMIQENLINVGENDLVINNIVEPGSDCSTDINGKVGITIDNLGHSCSKSGDSFNDHDIGPIKEHKATTSGSDSKSKPGPGNRSDDVSEQQEANMESLRVKETTENVQKVEILNNQLNYDIPHFHVDTKDKAEFDYVKYVLEISGLTGIECLSAWHSSDHPVDPLLYEEMEGDPDFCCYGGNGQCNHHVLFDLINETLLELHGRSYCYCPMSLSFLSHVHLMPKGCRILHQVWTHMNKSLCMRPKVGLTIDDHVSIDLARRDGWLNLQLFADCVGVELEDMIFHHLLEEIVCDLACI